MTRCRSLLASSLFLSVGRSWIDRPSVGPMISVSSSATTGPVTPPNDPPASGIFAAIQEQLGLKLESARASVDVLVIDRIDRPTAN
jgi:uncharacterized protein (TIGR03435 family)